MNKLELMDELNSLMENGLCFNELMEKYGLELTAQGYLDLMSDEELSKFSTKGLTSTGEVDPYGVVQVFVGDDSVVTHVEGELKLYKVNLLRVMIREQIENENMLCSYSSYQSNKPYFISISTLLDKISNSVPYENWVWNEEGSVVFAYEEDGYQVEMIMDNVSYLQGSKDALYHFANKYATLEETDYFAI